MLDSLISGLKKILPDWLIARFAGDWSRQGLKKYMANTGWMLGARIITFLTSFLTVAVVARYLGPENLGKLDYAQSFIAIISVFASLGIDQILYRELVAHPENEHDLLGTSIFSKLIFGTLAFFLSIALSLYFDNEFLLTVLIALSATTFIIGPFGTVGILFNAQVKAKYSSHIQIFLAFFIPALKLVVVFFDKGVIYFSAILIVESLVTAVWSLWIYMTKFRSSPRLWRFSLLTFKQLMHDAWPLLLAGFSGYVYAKMDQVLLLHFIDSAAVGIYGVAVKLTQIWAFLPGLIISSIFPAIINARKFSFDSYAKRLRSLSGFTVGVTALIALPLFIFAPFIISIIFGDAYIAATPILRIYLWTSIVITLVVLAQHYLIAENLSRVFLYTSLIGAAANIILNVILIPHFGLVGSAWGTMLSYLIVVLALFLFKSSRSGLYKIFISKSQ